MKTNRPSAILLFTGWMFFSFAQTAPAQSRWGNALSFDGVDDHLTAGTMPWFGNEFTVETWVYPRTLGRYARILDFGTGGGANGLEGSVVLCLSEGDSGRPSLHIFQPSGEDSAIVSTQALPLNQWSHVAVSLQGSQARLYLNGALAQEGPVTANPITRFKNYIGRSNFIGTPGDPYLDALLDDFRIWDVARTAAQIQEAMLAPLSGAEPGLMAYWKFDEATGTSALNAVGDYLHAKLVNGPVRTPSGVPIPTGATDQTVDQGNSITLPLPYSDLAGGNLAITVISENPVLLPNTPSSILIEGSGVNRTLTLTPVAEHSGTALIRVMANNGADSTTFALTVRPRLQSPLLTITSATPALPNALRLQFQDSGTGSTNYQIEFRGGLAPTNQWVTLTNVTPGVFQADVVPPPGGQGFFRVSGSRILTASFDSARATVDEGAGTITPVIVFNGPFQGTVRYTLSGTLGTNDYAALSGEVQVNGTTVAIPIALTDNQIIDSLRYLTLRLEAGSGYRLGATRQSTITVQENDADWQGQLRLPGGPLTQATARIVYSTNGVVKTNLASIPLNNATAIGFVLRIQRSGNTVTGTLTDPGSGFFPSQAAPVQLTLTPDTFSATANALWLSSDTTPFNVPIWLDLSLTALNGLPNQTNSLTEIAGRATLGIHYSGLPHLDTTTEGTFLLLKPPVKPSTNEVQLVTAP